MMEDPSSEAMPRPPELGELVVVQASGCTDIGTKHHVNEDRVSYGEARSGEVALILCDGMGGMGSGDLVAQRVVDLVADRLARGAGPEPITTVAAAIQEADRVVLAEFEPKDGRKPGTTCSVVMIVGGVAFICWVGDSWAMVIRDGEILRQNRPHRMVQDLIDKGSMTPEQAKASPMRHLLTRSIGGREGDIIEVDFVAPVRLEQGDRIVICSDGLTDFVPPEEIAKLCRRDVPVSHLSRGLVQLALERRTDDNVSVIVAGVDASHGASAGLGKHWLPSQVVFDLADDYASEIRMRPPTNSLAPLAEPRAINRVAFLLLALVFGLIVVCLAVLGVLITLLTPG